MWITIGYLLPLVVLAGLELTNRYAERGRLGWLLRPGGQPVRLAILSAVPAIATLLAAAALLTDWPGGTQVAWTGVEAGTPEHSVAIGGPRDEALVAWPNGRFSPRLSIAKSDEGVLATVDGGGAFVRVDGGEFINGVLITPGRSIREGAYELSLRRRFPLIGRYTFEVRGVDGSAKSRFRLPGTSADRAYRLALHVAPEVRRLRALGSPESGAAALALEDWAEDRILMIAADGEVRLLDPDSSESRSVPVPCTLVVQWPPMRRLRVEARVSPAGRLALAFPPPWRLSSPLPVGMSGSGQDSLVFTKAALPGDRAFLLPLGDLIADPRMCVPVQPNASGSPVLGGPPRPRPEARTPVNARATSVVQIPTTMGLIDVVTARSLPRVGRLAVTMTVAWLVLFASLLLLRARRPVPAARATAVLMVVMWTLLCLRVMLAVRYAIDPAYLDRLALKGIAVASSMLAICPALVSLAARFHADGYLEPTTRVRLRARVLTIWALAAGASVMNFVIGARICADVPESLRPSLSDRGGGGLVLVLLAYSLACTWVRYFYEARELRLSNNVLIRLLVAPGHLLEWVERGRAALSWEAIAAHGGGWRRAAAAMTLALAIVLAGASYFAVSDDRVFQELVVPALLLLLPALIVLSAADRNHTGPARPSRLAGELFAVLIFVVVPLVAVPLAVGDVGAILAAFAVFVPVSIVLLCSRARRAGLLVSAGVAAVIVAGAGLAANADSLPSWMPQRATVRLLSHAEGEALQALLPFAALEGEGARGSLPIRGLRDAMEHNWENRAMIGLGGIWGLGFGSAPARQSAIPQDTIQFDSVFSFFIAGDHGAVGGISLILIYAAPVIVVLWSARRRLDLGHAIAIVICSSQLFEALIHMAMNVGLMPFSGRNLPLLAVNSITDPARWLMSMMIVAICLNWRSVGVGSEFRRDKGDIDRDCLSSRPRSLVRHIFASAVILTVPAALAVAVTGRVMESARDHQSSVRYSWDGMLGSVQSLLESGAVKLDPRNLTLSLDRAASLESPWPLRGWSLLEQEIARFNSLERFERYDGSRSTRQRDMDAWRRLQAVRKPADYDALLRDLRREDAVGGGRRACLFVLRDAAPSRTTGGDSVVAEVNRDFGRGAAFKIAANRTDFVRWHAGTKDGPVLVGPAWVMGHWTSAHVNGWDFPWAGQLAAAMGLRDGLGASASTLDADMVLSLDPDLQARAQAAARTFGRTAYERALLRTLGSCSEVAQGAASHYPPRVAITVLSMPDGEILAMGGWPHATAGETWRQWRSEPIPPVGWAVGRAPKILRTRYESDRNLDRLNVGSASKPLWASAVLALHPGLDRALLVRGSERSEDRVFGVRVAEGRPWRVSPSQGWTDWTSYLAESDNRYHVRLGFLGLASRSSAGIVAGGGTGSDNECLDGRGVPWGQYPLFAGSGLQVVDDVRPFMGRPGNRYAAVAGLDESQLAKQLRAHYGIGIAAADSERKLSFWTGDSRDDRSRPDRELAAVAEMSPTSPNFRFDAVKDARAYVSLLLGGGENKWSNVDFAGAFGTCVTGRPVVPHVATVELSASDGSDSTVTFPAVARALRPGLQRVVSDGTATAPLGSQARAFINSLDGVKCYAKTGTLDVSSGGSADGCGEEPLSRIAIALIRWDHEHSGRVSRGLVISVVGERSGAGAATEAVGAFMLENANWIRRQLGAQKH